MKVAVLMAASLVSSAAHAQQFDLICTGQNSYQYHSDPEKTKEWADTFRVDLTKGRWCRTECQLVNRIERQDDNEIVFNSFNSPVSIGVLSVNRRTGVLTEDTAANGVVGSWQSFTSANCVLAPFTGFPPPRF
jgi:hypothetical protein